MVTPFLSHRLPAESVKMSLGDRSRHFSSSSGTTHCQNEPVSLGWISGRSCLRSCPNVPPPECRGSTSTDQMGASLSLCTRPLMRSESSCCGITSSVIQTAFACFLMRSRRPCRKSVNARRNASEPPTADTHAGTVPHASVGDEDWFNVVRAAATAMSVALIITKVVR